MLQEPTVPFDQGRDSALAALTDHQIPFARARNTSICCFLGPGIDADHPEDLAAVALITDLRFVRLDCSRIQAFANSPLRKA
ncbi:hypothetical protein [Arthrobacter sp.]|uniref:hypothetical protein n=1 Tax=Arthrobacter sp. TaxID=1667 RepID=UPI0026DF3776|nr:hypothetical protein [Arthrobacter sp.]MDO5752466.1 hypothetical protein [Arthrobacter sp.]